MNGCFHRLLLLGFSLAIPLGAREFSLLVYNVENLFDVDGEALFPDYQDARSHFDNPYTPARLLTKLRHIAETLAAVDEGRGPDIILFQEFELDRTPAGSGGRPADLLAPWKEHSVAEMLGEIFDARVANLPVEALLWKFLQEAGLGRYEVVKPQGKQVDAAPAHNNVVFTRFPVLWSQQRGMERARDLLVVALDVEGHELIVLNNHWKSGASSRGTSPVRRQNAAVARAELERLLQDNPHADVILAGDFNSNYNQSALFPDWGPVGIQDILRSQTQEAALRDAEGAIILYNLWGELPFGERGSEVYRGQWGTLMQILLTPGLYDRAGIQYVDNSFFRLILPGRNVDRFGKPRRWIAYGDGGGFSDHLPIGARFRVLGERGGSAPILRDPTDEPIPPAETPSVDYGTVSAESLPPAESLTSLTAQERVARVGEVFRVKVDLRRNERPSVELKGQRLGLYAPDPELWSVIESWPCGRPLHLLGQLNEHRGELEFVVHHRSWLPSALGD